MNHGHIVSKKQRELEAKLANFTVVCGALLESGSNCGPAIIDMMRKLGVDWITRIVPAINFQKADQLPPQVVTIIMPSGIFANTIATRYQHEPGYRWRLFDDGAMRERVRGSHIITFEEI